MTDIVAIKTYGSQVEAEAARIVLAENGITATVSPSGVGTRNGFFAWIFREVDVLVSENDVDDAKQVLELAGDPIEALKVSEADKPSETPPFARDK